MVNIIKSVRINQSILFYVLFKPSSTASHRDHQLNDINGLCREKIEMKKIKCEGVKIEKVR